MVYEVVLADGSVISDDRARLDLDLVCGFLAEHAYWALGRPRAVMERAIQHSFCFGLYDAAGPGSGGQQIGFARVLSDRALRAHLNDVFVLPERRGRGLGRGLVGAVLEHPELRQIPTWSLTTRDAHALYASFGFGPLDAPGEQMIRLGPHNHRQTS